MDFSQMPVLTTSTPPESPTGPPASPSFRSPTSIMGSPLSPRRRPRTSSTFGFGGSPLRSPPALGPESGLTDVEEPEKIEPRLVIRKLVLINYKSYAGRQEIGPFNENFTAVVGPNGSGKSNVIDSLLFAFGFRAKKMRQDKLTGLIHNSENNPNLQFARVEVHFETTGVPDSELRLAREVRRDGSNFYMMNDKRCSYAEVARLLEDRGIDLRHKRFLILQGEVESISLMPPKAENNGDDGLLEYLEDIIGTSNYKMRIEELQTECETAREDATEKQNRADIVYKDVRKLDAERADIERYMINQNRGTIARSNLYQLRAWKLKNTISITETELAEENSHIERIRTEMAEKRDSLELVEKEAEDKTPQITQWKKELKEVSSQFNNAKLKEVKLKQQRDQISKRLKKAERDLAHAKSVKSQAEIWLKNFDGDSEKLQAKLAEVISSESAEKAVLQQMQEELQESTKGLQDDVQKLQNQAEPYREQTAAKTHEISVIERELNNMKTQVDELNKREQEVTSQAEKIIESGKTAKRQVRHFTENYEALIKEREQTAQDIKDLTVTRDQALAMLEQLRPEVAAAQESRASSQSRNRIESELMRLKIPGLYGRLGSLGSIDKKYDCAISTAGPELNNFVVDNVETAKRCLEELRKRSIGRAKFMVLDKLREPRHTDPSQFPAPRLLDLVQPVDPIFMKAFNSALGDTLVADTPEDASRFAFGGPRRHKVVTLGGMLMNSSGQMSGGGAPARGLMAKTMVTVSPEEMEQMERKLARHELEYADARQRLAALQGREESLNAAIPRAQMELEKEQMSLKQEEAKMGEIKERRRDIKSRIKQEQEKCDQFESDSAPKKAALEKEISQIELESRPIEEQIQALQEQILNFGGLRFRNQKNKVTELEEREADVRREINGSQENAAQEMSKLKKSANDISRFESEIDECAQLTASLDQDSVDDIPALEAEIQKLSVYLEKSSSDIDAAKARASAVRVEIDELRAGELEVKNTLKKLTQTIEELSKRLSDNESRLKSLKLHDVSIARSLDSTNSSAPPVTSAEVESADNGSHSLTTDEDTMNDGRPSNSSPENPPDSSISLELPELSPDEIGELDEALLKSEITNSDRACEAQSIDLDIIKRYRARFTEFMERKNLSDEAIQNYETIKNEVQSLTTRRHNEFMEGFRQISAKLKELYQLITMGGNAELELVDTMDPFAEGILFSVMPPKKSWRNIANLSGGEKTLSSLALVFALHHYKPTPLYVMDEIDAALDFRNVSIIANYIKERTKNGQFIVISLRNNMFELASRLVGVYKVDNMTRSVTLQTN